MIKLDQPHITGDNLQEQVRQLISFQRRLVEQLNVELNRELAQCRQKEEQKIDKT